MLYKSNKIIKLKELQEESQSGWDTKEAENQIKKWTFRDWSRWSFGQEREIKVGDKTLKKGSEEKWKSNREELAEKIEELKKERWGEKNAK